MATTFDTLPNELLCRIIVEVNLASTRDSPLQTCLLVCKRWKDATLPYLFRHLVITNSNIDLFTERFNPSHGPLVRSLTFEIADISLPFREADLEASTLEQQADRLCSVIKVLSNLTTFSVTNPPIRLVTRPVSLRPRSRAPTSTSLWKTCRRWVSTITFRRTPRRSSLPQGPPWGTQPPPRSRSHKFVALSPNGLSSLIMALPDSCVNLQIDLASLYSSPERHTTHVCETLRHVLPRMQHVRLHMNPICSHLFGAGERLETSVEDGEDQQHHSWQPISLPNMKTLVINCISAWSWSVHSNCPDRERRLLPSISSNGWPSSSSFYSATRGLQLLTQKEGSILPTANLSVVGIISDNDDLLPGIPPYSYTFIKSNMANRTTLALPVWLIHSRLYLLRTIDGEEFVSNPRTLQIFAEGNIWKTTVGRARLPAEVFEEEKSGFSPDLEEESLPIMESSVWRVENPATDIPLWDHEAKTGVRMLNAEARVGSRGFLERRPIHKKKLVVHVGETRNIEHLTYHAV